MAEPDADVKVDETWSLVSRDSPVEKYGSQDARNRESLASDSLQSDIHIYKRRWWMLTAFSFCCIVQAVLWNAWTPISDVVEIVYNWNPSVIAMVPAINDIANAVSGVPIMYINQEKGLRMSTVLCASMLVGTMVLWNIAAALEKSWIMMVGAFLNGIAGSVTIAVPALLSATWFPVTERMTATSMSVFANAVGSGMSFLVGPYLSGPNVTDWDIQHKANLTSDVGLAALCLLCVLIYYPAKPPRPPSVSASLGRVDFWTGLKSLVKNVNLCLLLLSFVLPGGSYYSWISMVSVNFRDLGVSQAMAGWIGLASILTGSAASVLLAAFVDHFKKKTKLFLVLMCLISIASTAILACIQDRYIHIPKNSLTEVLYVLAIFIGVFIHGMVPLYFELGCEIAYPVHEGLTCSYFTICQTLCETTYLLIFLNPILAQDTRWMTWTLMGTCVISLLLLLLLRESYNRLDIDESDQEERTE